MEIVFHSLFPSPIGVFLFISNLEVSKQYSGTEFPSPVGVFLFILIQSFTYGIEHNVSVPYRGLSFYIYTEIWNENGTTSFRPLSGSFFLYSLGLDQMEKRVTSFRPLSGSFFLYFFCSVNPIYALKFPSPIGVFLFIFDDLKFYKCNSLFPSPIGVFLFISEQVVL